MNRKQRVRRPIAAAALFAAAFAASTAGVAQAGTMLRPPAAIAVAAATAPTTPRSLTAAPGNASVKLAWRRPASNGGAAIDHYAVQRARYPAGPWKRIATPTTRRYTARGLTNGTRYYFRVAAHNAAGWSPRSPAVSAVPRTVPPAPQSPQAELKATSLYVNWLPPSSSGGAAIDNYEVTRSADKVNWTSEGTTDAAPGENGMDVDGLTIGVTYYFRVRAHNTAGWGPWSTTVSAVWRTAPSAPQGLWYQHDKITGLVTFYWSPPVSDGGATVDHYVLEMSFDNQYWFAMATTSATDQTVSFPPTTQYWRVRAHNSAGYGPPSNVTTVNVP
jgi:hypothetical protein